MEKNSSKTAPNNYSVPQHNYYIYAVAKHKIISAAGYFCSISHLGERKTG